MEFVVVELESGEQEFFESKIDGFKWARAQEDKERNCVAYVAIGEFWGEDGSIFRGQLLRSMLRTIDNTLSWIRAVDNYEETEDQTDEG